MKHPRRIPKSGLSDYEAYRRTWTPGGLSAIITISVVMVALLAVPQLVVAGAASAVAMKLLTVVRSQREPTDRDGSSAISRVAN